MLVAIAGVAIAGILGSLLGLVAGYVGGLLDEFVMRIADAALAIPLLVLGLALATILGRGTGNVVVVVACLTWAFFARLVRGEVLHVRTADYITAVRLLGMKRQRILTHHVLPNVINPIVIMGTLQVGNTIIIAAGLSFLGMGVAQPTPEWGLMLAESQRYLSIAPWMAICPGVAVAITVLAANVLGDWLRERLDPRGKSRLN